MKFSMNHEEFVKYFNHLISPRQIGDIEGARRAGELFSYPLMIKSKRLAYDGRGNAVANNQDELSSAVMGKPITNHM